MTRQLNAAFHWCALLGAHCLPGLESSVIRVNEPGGDGLTGPLPNDLTGTPLDTFYWSSTGLCAPTDTTFQACLDSISDEQGAGDCS